MTDECEKPVNGHRHTISISINGIAYKTQENKLTTAEILALAGFTPEDYTLVRKEKPSEALPLDQPIHLKDGDEFLALRKTNTVSEIGGMKDLESFFSERLGVAVDYLKGGNGENLIIHDVEIPAGPLVGKVCDIGIQCTVSSPFNPHPAFHTGRHLCLSGQTRLKPEKSQSTGSIGADNGPSRRSRQKKYGLGF